MKMMKKALALVLAIVMLFSMASVTTFATNGKTITITVEFTSDVDGTNIIEEVGAGETFYMWVTFAGNPTVLADSIQGYGLLFEYDEEKISCLNGNDSAYPVLALDVFNHEFAPGVMYASWAKLAGILSGRNIAAEGTLFSVDLKAEQDLTATDLLNIKILDNATSGNGTLSQTTQFLDGNGKKFTYVQDSNIVAPTPEPTATPTPAPTAEPTATPQPTATPTPAPEELSSRDFSIPSKVTYTGEAITVEIETDLTEDDYDVEYIDNINAGTAKVVFTGKGNYTGTVEKTFTIAKKAISTEDFSIPAQMLYTGEAIEVEVETALLEDDYTVTYTNNKRVGRATVTIKGVGNYTGTVKKYFQIVEEQLPSVEDFEFIFDLEDKEYTGEAITPSVTTDMDEAYYDVTYSNNINAGTATITVTGKDGYVGEIIKKFTITKKAITDEDFSIPEMMLYTGKAIKVDVETALLADDYSVKYSNNTRVGTAKVTFTGKGNYKGTVTKTFEIIELVLPQINETDFTFDLSDKTYTGEAIEPTVTSTMAETDYEVEYKDNINAGVATIIVKGVVNYGGTIEKTFIINPIYLDGALTIEKGAEDVTDGTVLTAVITGVPQEADAKITWMRDGVAIKDADDETYTVQNADKGTEITVKVVAEGNYVCEFVSSPVSVPATAPSFDEDVKTTPSQKSIKVKLDATSNGSAITSYEIYVNEELVASVEGTETSYTITGLEKSTEYSIKVVAVNEIGRTESEEFTVKTKAVASGGGGGGIVSKPSYQVAQPKVEGGSVKTNVSSAKVGQDVKLEITAEDGYVLSEVIVLDEKGNEIEVKAQGEDYSFVMPEGKVEIKPVFVPDENAVKDEGFKDVKEDDYYHSAVAWAVAEGITNGVSGSEFGASNRCTRAQLITLLYRAAGSQKAENSGKEFADVAKDSYYHDAILWAVAEGITTGTTEDLFSPDAYVSRAQAVTLIWRLASSPATPGAEAFADVDETDFYGNAVAWAVKENITNGVSSTHFAPNDVCNRAQIVTFLHRYFSALEIEEEAVEEIVVEVAEEAK